MSGQFSASQFEPTMALQYVSWVATSDLISLHRSICMLTRPRPIAFVVLAGNPMCHLCKQLRTTYICCQAAISRIIVFITEAKEKVRSLQLLRSPSIHRGFCSSQSQLSLGKGRVLLIAGPSLMATMQSPNRTSEANWGSVSCSRTLQHAAQLSTSHSWDLNRRHSDH